MDTDRTRNFAADCRGFYADFSFGFSANGRSVYSFSHPLTGLLHLASMSAPPKILRGDRPICEQVRWPLRMTRRGCQSAYPLTSRLTGLLHLASTSAPPKILREDGRYCEQVRWLLRMTRRRCQSVYLFADSLTVHLLILSLARQCNAPATSRTSSGSRRSRRRAPGRPV
jgi:hypothetical protein